MSDTQLTQNVVDMLTKQAFDPGADKGAKKLDNGGGSLHHPAMDYVGPRELDAKLQLIEERMDNRVRRIEDAVASAGEAIKETKVAISNLKSTMIVTAIGAVLTTVFGIAAFNATVLSNMVASFESGKTTAAALATASNELGQTRDQLKAIQERLDKTTNNK